MLKRELSQPFAHGVLKATVWVSGDDGPEVENLLERVVAGVDHYLSCSSCGVPGELSAFIETFGEPEGETQFETDPFALEFFGRRVELTLGGELDATVDVESTKIYVGLQVVPSLFGRLADMVMSDALDAAISKCGIGDRVDEMMAADMAQITKLLEAVFGGDAKVLGFGLGFGARDGVERPAAAPIMH